MRYSFTILRPSVAFSVFILLSGWASYSFAQPANNSPYSRYGMGNLNSGVNVRSAGVGGISIAMREDSIPYLVNFLNPASYTSLGFTSFDIGIYGNVATISSATEKENVNRANLSYFALGFPVTKWWGGAFGLREFSSIQYSVTDSRIDTTFGQEVGYAYKFQGDGGLNQVFIGLGLKPFRNFSLGVNASYLFGRMNRIQRVEFSSVNYFNVKTERFTDVGGFYVDYGMQYTFNLKRGGHAFTLGTTFAHPLKVRANSSELSRTYTVSAFGEDLHRDTVKFEEIKGGSITTPWKFGFGATWKKSEKWLVGAEFTRELWSSFRDVYGKNDSLVDAWRTAVGLEYKPSVAYTNRGFWAYFGKMHYRLGGHYALSQYRINGIQLPEYGITLGFGFPLKRSRAGTSKFLQSMINVAVEWGQRGTTGSNLVIENYWNFKLGFTLNDRWFIKRKYD